MKQNPFGLLFIVTVDDQIMEDMVRTSGPQVPLKGLVVLLTGLSGAGKTTLSRALHEELRRRGIPTDVIDGDEIRKQDPVPLSFDKEGRESQARRLREIAEEKAATPDRVVLVAAIVPFRASRQEWRRSLGRFLEVFVDCPLAICEARDAKGLYRKARDHEISDFTGISSPYEPPDVPDVHCFTALESVESSMHNVLKAILVRLDRQD